MGSIICPKTRTQGIAGRAMVVLMVGIDFVTSACKRIQNAPGDWADWAKCKQLLDGGPNISGLTER